MTVCVQKAEKTVNVHNNRLSLKGRLRPLSCRGEAVIASLAAASSSSGSACAQDGADTTATNTHTQQQQQQQQQNMTNIETVDLNSTQRLSEDDQQPAPIRTSSSDSASGASPRPPIVPRLPVGILSMSVDTHKSPIPGNKQASSSSSSSAAPNNQHNPLHAGVFADSPPSGRPPTPSSSTQQTPNNPSIPKPSPAAASTHSNPFSARTSPSALNSTTTPTNTPVNPGSAGAGGAGSAQREMSDGTTGSGRRQRTFSGTFWNSKNNPITMMVNAYNRRQQRRSVEAEARDREASRANEITWPFSFEHVYYVTVDPESATGFNVSLCCFMCDSLCVSNGLHIAKPCPRSL
jgi:hypothetical protein